ncbi:metal-dependent transcriptional regulator [Tetragenococcus halophilus]|uniref:Manganese transport regulator n=1 Tax=Tetragenococcus halophilus (strain DSM 20338 / JCM 20259 / NCIMB 9735 / NBRC 12172) TaxID=945021 RepID=A0AAN1SFN3_TETHN|nr:metal-dependent transcriptional regulator [Tetragenococcus halophilus]MCO7025996.1 metal-dependent transcriptional regulator [Tetragenococcus halophilus]NRR74991.1 metal-dependent transcriptional regulator [Tetragenococcus halophilus]NWN98984.1 metal-dependent transcriptional regulator [Tetragenococcus halophilus]RQD29272.1 metal-dependent transcriptional regulator [Tetragenococcus halophilus subsp. halophilus DSM 20339]WJS83186.1 metal-dependent transcriptional regulator [Tetragenococcus h
MTPNREDYLKLILELGDDQSKINNKQIVSGLDVSAASVSEMINKLVKENLVEHTPYQGVQLTDKGLEKASSLVRRHRLWEVFLVEHLKYSWNEVHDDAEVLEHVTSETLAHHLNEYLEHPKHCPHGGMIPKENQLVHEKKREKLTDYPVGTKVRIARVLDERELLDYLVDINVSINEEYTITDVAAYEGPITIKMQAKSVQVSYKAASTIFVDKI